MSAGVRRLASPVVDTEQPTRIRPGVRAAVAVGALGVLGVLGGVTWWLLWEPSYYVVTDGQAAMAEPDLGRRFAADGWFAVIGAVLGLVSGAVVTWRSRRGRLVGLLALVLGSFLAVATMRLTGMLLGPADADAVLADAADGARVPVELAVTVPGFHLVWPIAALLAACAVLWGGTDTRPVDRHTGDPASRPEPGPAPDPGPWAPPSFPPHQDPGPSRQPTR